MKRDPEDENTEFQVRKATDNLGDGAAAIARALMEVPRELFRTSELTLLAYSDKNLPVAEGRSLQPIDVTAKILSALELTPNSTVLEVGTGVGYTAALLSKLSAKVFSIDRLESLITVARRNLDSLDIRNVTLSLGENSIGLKEKGPFDAIFISASGLKVPGILKEQLNVGGRLVMPIGPHRDKQNLVRVRRKSKTDFVEEHLGQLRFVMRLGDILVDLGLAERQDVEQAALRAAATAAPVGEVIRQVAKVEEPDVYRALAAQRGLRYGTVDALMKNIDIDLIKGVTRSFMEYNQVIPIHRKDGVLTLATSDPDPMMADLTRAFHPDRLEICLVTPTDYRRLWSTIDRILSGKETTQIAAEEHDLQDVNRDSEAYFVQLFESLVMDAIGERASDIHLEQYGERIRVRVRVDGDMRDLPRYRISPADLAGVMNVIKVRSKLDISEHRLPQGGRVRIKAGGKTFDLRVQIQPSLYGEYAVIRILPEDIHLLSIDDLGFSRTLAARYRKLIEQPSGLVLVVGPTGSGKTTTLYAGLQILADDSTRKVITVEDPIEYAIENVQQTSARPDIGFAFADAVRSFLRLDPDVILVGEIRDQETALEAIRASQTGHLVFSTLHCNDSTDAVQRLFDLGMHSNSIASELIAVMSQRLPRRICESCKIPVRPDKELLSTIFPDGAPKEFQSYAGKGCARCRGFGTFNRVACVEFLNVDASLRMAISQHPPVEKLRHLALDMGLVTMRDAALDLVQREMIALSELPNILSSDRLAPERPRSAASPQPPASGT